MTPDSPQNPDDQTADFGFRKVPADQKAKYVLRHFNSIARKYDFMNTLLSLRPSLSLEAEGGRGPGIKTRLIGSSTSAEGPPIWRSGSPGRSVRKAEFVYTISTAR